METTAVYTVMDEMRVYSRRLSPSVLGCGVLSAVLTLTGLIALAAAVVFSERNAVIAWSLAGGAVGLVSLCLVVRTYVRPALTLTADELVVPKLIGVRRFQRSEIARVVRFTYDARNDVSRMPRMPMAILLRHDGTRLFQLAGALTSVSELDALFQRLAIVPEGSWDDVLTPDQAEQRYPNAIHPAMSSQAIRRAGWVTFALLAILALANSLLHR